MRRIASEYIYTLETGEPLRNGFVEFEDDGTIVRTGVCEDIAKEKVFYRGAVVPGFVNTHCHIELSHLKGKFVKGSGMAGFIDQINALRECAGKDERIECVRRWMEILWNQGVSAMGDISNGNDSFSVKAESPLYTRTFLEVFGTEPEDAPGVMQSVRKLQSEAESMGLDAAPVPHSCYTMSPELLEAAAADALESGFLSYHSQESPEEEEMISSGSGALYENRKKLGMSTPPATGKPSLMYFLERLQSVHPAPFNEHILLVHEVCLTDEAADAAKEVMTNLFIALCPLSNLFIHNSLPPIGMMREKGLKLTIGTDSLSSNDTLDMVREMLCIHSAYPDIPLGEILTWACLNGAEFLGKEDILGSILPGKKPGLVLVDNLSKEGWITSDSYSVRLV